MDAEYRAPRRLRRLPSWLLNQAALQANRRVAEAFAAAGVRRHHFVVLVALDEGGPASQAALGRRLSIDRSDMTVAIGELEAQGWIARARDERDRRRMVVEITPAGTRALAELDAHVETAQALLLEPLNAQEREQLAALLGRLV